MTKKPAKQLLVWADLGYGVRYWPANEAVIDFEIIEVFGYPDRDLIEWVDEEDGTQKPVESWEAASVYASGHLKWDGCINLEFNEGRMLHFCGKEFVEKMGRALARLYDVLGPMMSGWTHGGGMG